VDKDGYLRFVDTVVATCEPLAEVIVDGTGDETEDRCDQTSNSEQTD